MLAIKLIRIGKKGQPSYRVVVAEKRSNLPGPPVEDLGSYDISKKAAAFKKERIEYWLGRGAKPTATVHNLFVKHGVISGKKMRVKIASGKREAAAEKTSENAATEGQDVVPKEPESAAVQSGT